MDIIKRNVYVIENNQEIIDNISDVLSDHFNLKFVTSLDEISKDIEDLGKSVSLILLNISSDINYKDILTKKKERTLLYSIPVIAITSKKQIDEELLKNGIYDSFDLPLVKDDMFIITHINRIIELNEDKKLKPYEDNSKLILPAITIRRLFKSYGKKEVLKGLDLEVYNGELFGFIGRNGIGKSTTIDCTIGVKRFNSGVIELEGYSILEDPIHAKKQFGYVASEPTCYETMTGYEYLEFIASVYGISEKEFAGNANFLAKRLVLSEEDLDKSIANYSHGMKQKLCLIASLLNNPNIWILDEPTVGLDIMAVEELKKMMREYANHGKCVFVTSHNIDIIAKICDRVAIINNGKVVELLDLNKDPNKRLQLNRIFLNEFGVNQ